MSKYDATNTLGSVRNSVLDKRRDHVEPLMLMQIDPSTIVDGMFVNGGYLTQDFAIAGEMRETCPECQTIHLSLVLLQHGVKRAHLFCKKCTRCFDACYPTGESALL